MYVPTAPQRENIRAQSWSRPKKFIRHFKCGGDSLIHIKILIATEASDKCHISLTGGEGFVLSELLLVLRKTDRIVWDVARLSFAAEFRIEN